METNIETMSNEQLRNAMIQDSNAGKAGVAVMKILLFSLPFGASFFVLFFKP